MSGGLLEREDHLAEAVLARVHHACEREPQSTLYALIDQALGDPFAEALVARGYESPRMVTLAIDLIAAHRRPYLVELRDERVRSVSAHVAAQEYLGQLDSESGQPRSVCAWLLTDSVGGGNGRDVLHSLAGRLNALAVVRSPVDGRRTVFRFWDPRLASDIARLLGNAWHGALTDAGLVGWWCIDRDGGVAVLLDSSPRSSASGAETSRWALDLKCWQALERCGWRNRIAQLLPDWCLASGALRQDPEKIVARAAEHGLNTEDDVVQFAHCAVTLHSEFDKHPKVGAALALSRSRGSSRSAFADFVRHWSEDFRAELRRGQWLETFNSQDRS